MSALENGIKAFEQAVAIERKRRLSGWSAIVSLLLVFVLCVLSSASDELSGLFFLLAFVFLGVTLVFTACNQIIFKSDLPIEMSYRKNVIHALVTDNSSNKYSAQAPMHAKHLNNSELYKLKLNKLSMYDFVSGQRAGVNFVMGVINAEMKKSVKRFMLTSFVIGGEGKTIFYSQFYGMYYRLTLNQTQQESIYFFTNPTSENKQLHERHLALSDARVKAGNLRTWKTGDQAFDSTFLALTKQEKVSESASLSAAIRSGLVKLAQDLKRPIAVSFVGSFCYLLIGRDKPLFELPNNMRVTPDLLIQHQEVIEQHLDVVQIFSHQQHAS